MKWQPASIILFFCPILSYGFFCPNNFSQIDYGYTPDQVIAICGKPDKQDTKEVIPEGPQEWNYYIPQTVATTGSMQQQGTLKTQMTFDGDGKLINVSVNGIGVGSTNICGAPVQLGDSREQVKLSCGDPTLVNTQYTSASAPKPTTVVTFFYNSNPPGTLVFEDNKLTSKQ